MNLKHLRTNWTTLLFMTQALEKKRILFVRRDLELWPEDGKRRELIGGDIFVSPSPTWTHQLVLFKLTAIISRYLEMHVIGQAVFAPMDLLLPGEDTVQPDFMFISNTRTEIISERGVRGAPDWIVEVLSSSNRDYDLETKRRLYARNGVPVYWAVDPEAREVRVFTPESESKFSVDAVLEVPGLDGFQLDVQALFA